MGEIMTLPVSIEDANLLLSLVTTITLNPYTDPDAFVEKIQEQMKNLKLNLADNLQEFLKAKECVACVLTGLPVELESEILLPLNYEDIALRSNFFSEAILIALVSYLGEPFCFEKENFGHLIQNIFPIEKHAYDQISSNAVELTLHVDAGYHPLAPDYTALLCLRERPEQKVMTYWVSMLEGVSLLEETERELLKQRRFVTEAEVSHGSHTVVPMAIWSNKRGQEVFRFDIPLTQGRDEESQQVVNKLSNIMQQRMISYCLQVGDLLILKNLECVHGRSAYQPKYDGLDRWLQRVFVYNGIEDLEASGMHNRQVPVLPPNE